MSNKKIYNEIGITLISLVVSIIVLLILAGISINMLTGDNGILQKTTEVRENTITGREKENIASAWNTLIGEKVLEGTEITDLMLEDELNKNEDKTMVGYDDDNNYLVSYKDTKHTYLVNKNGTITVLENAPSLITETIYVTLYSDGTLAFSSNSETDSTKTIFKTYTIEKDDIYYSLDMVPWKNELNSIKKVIFINEIRPISTACWFRSCINLENIINLDKLNTRLVVSMGFMFCGCHKLTSLDLRTFDTRRVTNMRCMFSCWADDGSGFENRNVLTGLNVSSFDTSRVTDMASMFNGCSSLTTLDISNFDTRNVANMFGMFARCSSLTSLNLSNFNTSNVKDIKETYQGMASMFQDCSNLTNLNVRSFDTSKVTDMTSMFYGCSSLTTLDLSGFDTKKVTIMQYMFANCGNLSNIYVSDEVNTALVSNSTEMFINCASIVGGKGTTYNSRKTDKTYARIDGGPSSSKPGYFTYKGN